MADPPISARRLGRSELVVSAQGLGCMGMSQAYGPADEKESLATILRALELGVSFLDTADAYGTGHNEELVGRAITGRRDASSGRRCTSRRCTSSARTRSASRRSVASASTRSSTISTSCDVASTSRR